jgi:hypothetical protein
VKLLDGSIDLDLDINLLDLDSAVKVLKMIYSFESWHNLLKLSDVFLKRITQIYNNYTYNNELELKHQRPLIYYHGYGLLMLGLAHKEIENYDEARACIKAYSDLSWFKGLDDEGLSEVAYYKFISEPNFLEVEVLSGNIEYIDRYVSFLLSNSKEVLPGLISLLKAATNFNLNIESHLNLFSNSISKFEDNTADELIINSYLETFFINMIRYKTKIQDYKTAIAYCMKLLDSAEITDSDKIFKQAVVYFESLRSCADTTQIKDFEEKIINFKERVESL